MLSARMNAGWNEDAVNNKGNSAIKLGHLIKPNNYDGKELFRSL